MEDELITNIVLTELAITRIASHQTIGSGVSGDIAFVQERAT